ncbi:1-(5-phosphoribosyl)-5-[(5-phosphoribosylamino)methylideneamino]imidazole-4-carboxamide isomerase [Caulobacter sp. NIBR1757]|uniref:1-(5-phosphoribosyl)-5-[(5- phosphoribosylamino)methylideneamino]imidazole-4- carboxamide isomerase n=1 Tax=Caulobacter sp. NIBR1757 TaxID=3016000 RepID=UPI0022F033B6|nr:1-(5-phosphoribosyl)-5-[(5-phosphoribosylamino)methylideneamino]imidazole-4-carboxamide isomerase [Caulobacter sp. NIBR1757]WGM37253.1 1-(5-phosphoribosyl)-5-[(5- phosphoribosylamino)methylideneamino] imidazole-4-carboxamide isomerase [Caulobacter sp. NIBR1757]
MILYPAIDLKDGRCVRLLHGDLSKETVFNASPADQATSFQAQGFNWLHVVDLNGAVEGRAVNIDAVSAILEAVSLPVQLGGGIRTLEQIETWIEAGISRVILGTVAVRDPDLVRRAARLWPEQIAVGIDARGGMVATQGWLETSDIGVVDLARKFEDAGVAALIVTDIGRDGAMTGVNVEQVGEVADAVSIPVIASGGVASIRDIEMLKTREGVPIAGCILGRSLYEGAIDPAQALTLAAC